MTSIRESRIEAGPESSGKLTQKWGGMAALLLAVSFLIAPIMYLTGNLRDTFGPLSYAAADLLYGPVWAASLVTMVFAVRERIAEAAKRRMSLALLAAGLAAAAWLTVACMRASNRQYHLGHPELHLENSIVVLTVWATLVAGVAATGWHLLGWSLVLIGSSGWTSRRLPRPLSALYLAAGVAALPVYALPVHLVQQAEANATFLAMAVSIYQGVVLLRTARSQA